MTIEQLVLERLIAIAWIVLTWMTWQFGKGAMAATASKRRANTSAWENSLKRFIMFK